MKDFRFELTLDEAARRGFTDPRVIRLWGYGDRELTLSAIAEYSEGFRLCGDPERTYPTLEAAEEVLYPVLCGQLGIPEPIR